MEELDDKEFELMLQEKRHAQIIAILTEMLTKLGVSNDTNVDVNVDTSRMEAIIAKINTAPDFSSIPTSIKAIGDVIAKKIEAQKFPKPINHWVHKITRDDEGLIDIVTSKGK